MTGRDKQKIRANVKRILIEIDKAARAVEESDSPFDAVGSTDARFISAEGAYKTMLKEVDWEQVSAVINTVNERNWRDEEYAKILTAMVACASKIAAIA